MPNPEPTDPIVGIDLGTTNSLVAFVTAQGPEILPSDSGEPGLPSVVRYSDSGDVLAVGESARREVVEHPRTTISSVKRLMGRSRKDAEGELAFLGYEVVHGERDAARIALPSGALKSPEEVSAEILRALKDRAQEALGTDVHRAVITVPAYFDDAQRQATRHSAQLAGLQAVRIVNEPTAAALAYGIGRSTHNTDAETIAVFDLGGGTLDVSILRMIPGEKNDGIGGADMFRVLSTAGDTRLGGDDIDRMLVELFTRETQAQFGTGLDFTASTRQSMRLLAEHAKIKLSSEGAANVRIEIEGASNGGAYERTIARAEFQLMIEPLISRALVCCERALRDAKLTVAQIDRVVMVGGSTRIPLVRERVGSLFQREPYTALDPDRVVALGAAVQASILDGREQGALLLDVIPLSLGIETVGGAVAKMIMRNASVPARATEMFSTSVDGQTSIKLHVVQGEREMVEDCRSLGEFHLSGVPPMPAGIPQLEVLFMVDANGVLDVSAVEKRSGKRTRLQVVPHHGLSAEEVDRIELESYKHARDDMTRHRVVDLVANSRLDLKWIAELVERVGADIDPEKLGVVTAGITELQKLVERGDADWRSVDAEAFHHTKQSLDEASVPLHEASIARSLSDG